MAPFSHATPTRLASGLAWPEGPTLLADGRIAFVETYRSRISVLDPDGQVRPFAQVGGGPNAALAGAKGEVYLTQNGGVIGPWRAEQMRPPSIQVVQPDGRVDVVAERVGSHQLRAPNDLAFGPNGWLYFTDPGGAFDPVARENPGFICALKPDGTGVLLAELPPCYPNGIVVEDNGDLVWVESYTRKVQRMSDGTISTLCTLPENCTPDGLKISAQGHFLITGCGSGTVEVITRDGDHAGRIALGKVPTNCLFARGGLVVTDGGRPGRSAAANHDGSLWLVPMLSLAGQVPFPGHLDATPP